MTSFERVRNRDARGSNASRSRGPQLEVHVYKLKNGEFQRTKELLRRAALQHKRVNKKLRNKRGSQPREGKRLRDRL